ncbi:MAG: hypothetical protein OJF50_001200 [Nitrospira sp.]|jgi:hypothetical protein|nr:hypothetical protein [Nitrospira sp.]
MVSSADITDHPSQEYKIILSVCRIDDNPLIIPYRRTLQIGIDPYENRS